MFPIEASSPLVGSCGNTDWLLLVEDDCHPFYTLFYDHVFILFSFFVSTECAFPYPTEMSKKKTAQERKVDLEIDGKKKDREEVMLRYPITLSYIFRQ